MSIARVVRLANLITNLMNLSEANVFEVVPDMVSEPVLFGLISSIGLPYAVSVLVASNRLQIHVPGIVRLCMSQLVRVYGFHDEWEAKTAPESSHCSGDIDHGNIQNEPTSSIRAAVGKTRCASTLHIPI